MLTLFSSIADVSDTFKTSNEIEEAGAKIELFWPYQTRQRRTFAMSSRILCFSEHVDLKVGDL